RRCLQLVNTRAISTQITALRKEMVTAEFNKRIQSEIEVLDLNHIPFQLQETSSGGQNLFSIGLQKMMLAPDRRKEARKVRNSGYLGSA
ncbi:hypothetical protein ACC687_38965, partial [Rhizobium ruizarguesonis]